MNKKISTKSKLIILSLILFLALIFRLYKINSPLADAHSWRQADTAAVSRNFLKDGFDLLHPRYDDLSGRESGKENPEGFRMVEFPLYNAIFASLNRILPALPLEMSGRLISIFFSLLIIAVIYFLLEKEVGLIAAAVAGLTYAVLPFFVFFSRVVLPETTALGLTFVSIFFLYLFSKNKNPQLKSYILFFLSLIFFALGLLTKPTVIFYALVLIYLFYEKSSFGFLNKINFYLYFCLSFLPLLLWRIYIKNFPEGIPASDWLITSVNTYDGLKFIFLRPAFIRWIFFERINNSILGGYLSSFFLLGILRKNRTFLFPVFLLSSLLFLFIFEGGNVQHEYYQIIILPSLAIFVGLGMDFIWTVKNKLINQIVLFLIIFLVFTGSFFFSYYKIKDFYQVPQDLVVIAKIIKTITGPEDKIVTDRLGDTTLLYLADRKGWPTYSGNLDYLRSEGYKYLVTANRNLTEELTANKQFRMVFHNNQFTIFAL